jgi:uncharacterized protein YchJ
MKREQRGQFTRTLISPAEFEKLQRENPEAAAQFKPVNRSQISIDQIRGMKIGRNEPCACGSGKKYKKCCLGK